jgi:hypothetical protein
MKGGHIRMCTNIIFFIYSCDQCDVFPIVGHRYKCKVCENFDFCENCFRSKKHRHPFNRIGEPGESYFPLITVLVFRQIICV